MTFGAIFPGEFQILLYAESVLLGFAGVLALLLMTIAIVKRLVR